MSTQSSGPAIETAGLVKVFGETRAVDGVDLAVPAGTVYGVLGPNGAGKTTTVRMLATLLRPDGGEARVLRPRRRARGRRGARPGQPHRPVRVRRRGPHRHARTWCCSARLLGHSQPRRPRAGRRAAGGLRLDRGGRHARSSTTRAACAAASTSRASILDHPRPAVPRRADHRPRPAQPQPGVGHRAGARRPGHDGAADHAVPRRGRPARRPHRRHRPRQGDRRGHQGRAEGVGRRRLRASCGCATPTSGRRRSGCCAGPLDARRAARARPGRPDRPRRHGDADAAAEQAARALAELARAGITVDNFSLGQPSLDEVFLALTGHPTHDDDATPARQRRRTARTAGTSIASTTHRDRARAGQRRVARRAARRHGRARRGPARSSTSLTFGWRAMLKIKHVPEQLFDVTAFPIMFVLMFTYLFGGALAGSPASTSSSCCPASW